MDLKQEECSKVEIIFYGHQGEELRKRSFNAKDICALSMTTSDLGDGCKEVSLDIEVYEPGDNLIVDGVMEGAYIPPNLT